MQNSILDVNQESQQVQVNLSSYKPKRSNRRKSHKKQVKQDEFTQTEVNSSESVKFDRYQQYDAPMYMYQKNRDRSGGDAAAAAANVQEQKMIHGIDDSGVKQFIDQYNLNKAAETSSQVECQSTQNEQETEDTQILPKCVENENENDTSGESEDDEWVLVQQYDLTNAPSNIQSSDPKNIHYCSEDEDFQMINVQQ
eukprot:TRINITY_DN30866_c1_g3_i2.p1 TRINITY_DN30866_c1_g3~~TRINITY_DN30866_c1_g3_i2.p1  ORF type:complete len:218 (-),score=22.01 TRINITY_DN30866_c1_g3_i2:210-800(-)